MYRFGNRFKPLMWFMALLLAAVVAGCGGAGGDGGTGIGQQVTAAGAGTGVAGAGRGPAPVDLQAAGNFVILAETAITEDLPTSAVTGDVGLTPASGTLIDLTCAEVTGAIYTVTAAGPPCRVQNAGLLTTAKNDGIDAFFDARDNRVPDYIDLGAGNIGGLNLGPATYKWSTGVSIPTNLTLTGGPKDVWIFQIWPNDLSVGSGVQIILAGGALPQNVYWVTNNADLGTTSRFKGVILADNAIVMRTGATIDGRVFAGSAANLDQNTVRQPVP